MAKKTIKKAAVKKTAVKKTAVKKTAPKKVAPVVKVKDKAKKIAELDLKIENITLKADAMKKGNKTDKIIAKLLEEKAAMCWGKQKEDLEAAEEE